MIGYLAGIAIIGGICTGMYIKFVLPAKLRSSAEPCPTGPTAKDPAAVREYQLNPLASLPPVPTVQAKLELHLSVHGCEGRLSGPARTRVSSEHRPYHHHLIPYRYPSLQKIYF
ncbi:uncharacterized protein LOC124265525 [Haliotis rubra]|uniref:uncharacterized protein LOC124265525 n=1 Tax=Haliotis rubra TaxID=36100 RepID=UPI001EE563F5|nr:uncharacterized protein LOC124265525 [Haliotis rubra]